MLNKSKNGLLIFDEFRTDFKLPKWKKRSKSINTSISFDIDSGGNMSDIDFDSDMVDGDSSGFGIGNGTAFILPSDNISVNNSSESLLSKLKSFLKSKKKEEKPKISISDFFKFVKSSSIDLDINIYEKRVKDYLSAYKYAVQLNQDALAEELKRKIDEVKYESILLSSGMKTIITEEQVVKFYKESPKGLELTWIRNFVKVIPESVFEQKNKCDELNVFDNYVILHYDPDKKAYKEEKDPILFGVINGVRKLYYVADWIDEYCDLTLDQFIDKFGEDAIKANNISVKFKLK